MAEDDAAAPPIRLMNFVSQDELDRAKQTRGERLEDGTAQRDRPLFEILKENKDKKDAEFNERFKHRPPKALDEDETEFLDKLEMSRREYERQQAREEAEQLRSFQEAVAARSSSLHDMMDTPTVSGPEVYGPIEKNPNRRPLGGLIVSVKPQAKKAKTEASPNNKSSGLSASNVDTKPSSGLSPSNVDTKPPVSTGTLGALVSYSDESDDDS